MDSPRVFKAKVCLISEAAVGKTSLVRRYVEDVFDDRYVSTLGSKVTLKRLWLTPRDNRSHVLEVQLSLWDLIGERSYLDSLHQDYLRGAQGLVAVCDITRYSSFEALDEWIPAALRVTGDVPLVLVVNKTDLRGEIMCLYDEHEPREKAERYRGSVVRASAKTGENVNSIFGQLAVEIVKRFATPLLA